MTSAVPAPSVSTAWWRHAVIYQIYPRSWADANGDGIGDLPGITARLPHLRDLGVDAIWISPFYVSPMADAGYDVADYYQIDPIFGTLQDADALIGTAHELGLRVLVDLVPNHTSDEHAWFQDALAAGPGSAERARYLFRDGLGRDGDQPPNNWHSVFGGPAWERVREADGSPGQWYLHIFDVKQPDLNWDNPQVVDKFHDVLRFWMDRGVDGFRVDVAHGLVKGEGLPDIDVDPGVLERDDRADNPMWDQDGVHEIYRGWREVLDSYNPEGDPGADRILVAEAWVEPLERLALYTRSDEMHQAFNFPFLDAPWRAQDLREVIDLSLRIAHDVGAPSSWVLSNHDVVRHATRMGYAVGTDRPNGIGMHDPQPNAILGLRRARAATALMLALPGSAYLYQGEELGLPDHTALPDEVRQDPAWVRSLDSGRMPGEDAERGRDGCRVPMPWEAGETAYGFGSTEQTWLPQPEIYGPLAVDRQQGVAGSTLELYRTLLRLRREHGLGAGELTWPEGEARESLAGPPDVLTCSVRGSSGGSVTVLTNFGADPVALPQDAQVLVTSRDLVAGQVPTDTTVWLRG